jgi:hypothetical protein
VPASFAKDLCVYRTTNDKPNTSDASDKFSVDLGNAMFEALGVDRAARGHEPTGTPFATRVSADLLRHAKSAGSKVDVVPERRLNQFEQYQHVGALKKANAGPSKEFQAAWKRLVALTRREIVRPGRKVASLERYIDEIEKAVEKEAAARRVVFDEVGEESLLALDVTVSRAGVAGVPHLDMGLSLKWSLRTDRAQDCRSQGAKLSTLRRGRMPHFAALTMEPRPYMLNLLAGGSGEVDCVYHLHLPALTTAIEAVCGRNASKPRKDAGDKFRRLVDQRRIRDYDDLVGHVASL